MSCITQNSELKTYCLSERQPIFHPHNILIPNRIRNRSPESDVKRTWPTGIDARANLDVQDIDSLCARHPVPGLKSAKDVPTDRFYNRRYSNPRLVHKTKTEAKTIIQDIARKFLVGNGGDTCR